MYTAGPQSAHKIGKEEVAIGRRKIGVWVTGLVLAFFCTSEAYCASVTVAWDPSPSPDVAGYNLSYGPSTRNYTNVLDVGQSTTFCLFGLVIGGTYCMAVTAYNNAGLESLPSDEVVYTVPDGTYGPKFESGRTLKINNGSFSFVLGADPGQEVVIQSSTDLVHWVSISTNTVSGTALNFTDPSATNLIRVFRAFLTVGGVSQPLPIVLQLPNLPNPLGK